MSNVILSLGSVAFQDFEVPEKIAFGGAQRVAVQQLIGGGRVVDVLGDDAGEIFFSGIFSGADAATRAQTLDVARAAGDVLPLAWDAYFYDVVIAEFAADYEKPWWIPFSLRCVVATTATPDADGLPAAYLVSDDLGVVSSLLGQAGIVLNGLGSPTAAGLAVAQGVIANGLAGAGLALASGVSAVANAVDAGSGADAVTQLGATCGKLAALSAMSGYASRAASNLLAGF